MWSTIGPPKHLPSKAHNKQTAPLRSSPDQIIHSHSNELARARRLSTAAAAMASASAFVSLCLPTPSPSPYPPSFMLPLLRQARGGTVHVARAAGPAGAPSPLFNPRGDPFLSTLAAASPEQLAGAAARTTCRSLRSSRTPSSWSRPHRCEAS
jgi:hypothetical protein